MPIADVVGVLMVAVLLAVRLCHANTLRHMHHGMTGLLISGGLRGERREKETKKDCQFSKEKKSY